MISKSTEMENQHPVWKVNLHLPIVSEGDICLNEQQSLDVGFDAAVGNT